MTRPDFIRFLNSVWEKEPKYTERLNANPSEVFSALRELPPVVGKLINYGWVPKKKGTRAVTPQEAVTLLQKKMIGDGFLKDTLEFDIDYFVYSNDRKSRYIVKLYRADVCKGERKRVYGKLMELEFLVEN